MDSAPSSTYYVGMYFERLAGSDDAERDVAELRRLSREGLRPARRWRFNRDELHERS